MERGRRRGTMEDESFEEQDPYPYPFQRPSPAIHPAPSPVPYPPQPPLHTSAGNGRYSRRHNSSSSNNNNNSTSTAKANQASDTLRRRSVVSREYDLPLSLAQTAPEESPESQSQSAHEVDSSFRLSFSGLDMPSTSEDPLDNHSNPNGTGTGTGTHSDHLLPHNYYHSNAGFHHNVNASVTHRLHNSLTNVQQSPPNHNKNVYDHNILMTSQSHHSHPRQNSIPLQRAHTHHSRSPSSFSRRRPSTQSSSTNHDDDDTVSVASVTSTASRRRRQTSLTPQHQLDRRNSRRRVTQPPLTNTTANTTALVPNRYYLAGKSVQTEWSSPTRQRRSRSSLNNSHHPRDSSLSSHRKPKSKVSHADRDSPTNNQNHNILVLPSISIPNGNHDDYRHNTHPSQIKPPAFPQRRACVQATSVVFSFGTFKWCVIIQIILVIPLCLYVFDAHVQKKHAKQQLQQYNEEHEHILNQMMWMDQAAKKLKAQHHHKRNGMGSDPNNPDMVLPYNGDLFESYYADNSATEDLRDSVHKLRGQMRDMQYRIQQNSKARITEKYGEGPIRVYIHPEPEDPVLLAAAAGPAGIPQQDMTPEIALELFIEDTPHAVSTFLYQIERGHWNRVQMNWKSETTILSKPGSSVTSGMGDWMQTSRLEFLEQFPIKHCEVALVQEGQMGVLSLQINLVEVPFQDQEEVCIGRLLNDRLVLPKARGYFMAEFTTTSMAETEIGPQLLPLRQEEDILQPPEEPHNPEPPQEQQQEQTTRPLAPPRQQQQQQQQPLSPPVGTVDAGIISGAPPPHPPPPPVVEENQPQPLVEPILNNLVESESIPRHKSQPKPRLRGSRVEEAKPPDEEGTVNQVVPPLEEPGELPTKDDDKMPPKDDDTEI